MTSREHIHDWQYGEPREVVVQEGGARLEWRVVRFCKSCHSIEKIILKENSND